MREIKFRAWDKINNKMHDYGTDEECVLFEEGCDFMGMSFLFCQPNVIWMQYTGLKDKNGKEIYENDIVKCVSEIHSNLGPTGKFDTSYYEICGMEEDAYCFGTREIGKEYISRGVLRACAEKYYEVIGNIYENPELLEVSHG